MLTSKLIFMCKTGGVGLKKKKQKERENDRRWRHGGKVGVLGFTGSQQNRRTDSDSVYQISY